ncbi:MAG: hypothetical protein JNM58_02075 [Xanthomonadaceae bacterium]|nr:hypothetical protein [Xanthomonadaceae bacterium]
MEFPPEVVRAKAERDRWQTILLLSAMSFVIVIGSIGFAIRFDSKAALALAFIACVLLAGYMMFAWVRMLRAHMKLRRLQRIQ